MHAEIAIALSFFLYYFTLQFSFNGPVFVRSLFFVKTKVHKIAKEGEMLGNTVGSTAWKSR